MHAEVKVLMRGTGFPDAVGVGCEEEEERVWEGMGRELLGHGKRAGFQSESRGKPLQGRGVISALHF